MIYRYYYKPWLYVGISGILLSYNQYITDSYRKMRYYYYNIKLVIAG